MSRTLALTLVALCASAPAFAQRGTTPAPAVQAATPAPPVAKAIDSGLDPADANVTVEITVVDKAAGATATTTRIGTITVANQMNGSVRGLANNYSAGSTKLDPTGLDIDARAFLRKSGMVSVNLTVAYIPSGVDSVISSIQRQSATLFFKPGVETQVLSAGSMSGPGPGVKITAKVIVNK